MKNEKHNLKTAYGSEDVRLIYAYSGDRLVHISKSYKDGNYRCPICNNPVFPRKGEIRSHSYVHTKGHTCNLDENDLKGLILNVAAEILINNKSILIPPRLFNIGSTKENLLSLKNPEQLFFEYNPKFGAIQRKKFNEKPAVIVPVKTLQNERIAIILSMDLELNHFDLIDFQHERQQVLSVNLSGCESLFDPQEKIETILFDSIDEKEWELIDEPEISITKLKRIIPSDAIKSTYDTNCLLKKGNCEDCEYYIEKNCIYEYLKKNSRCLVQTTPNKSKYKSFFLFLKRVQELKLEEEKKTEAKKYLKQIIDFLRKNAPLNGQSRIEEVGYCTKDLHAKSNILRIFWGQCGTNSYSFLLESSSRSSANMNYLFRIETYEINKELLWEINVYYSSSANSLDKTDMFKSFEELNEPLSKWSKVPDYHRVNTLSRNFYQILNKVNLISLDQLKEKIEELKILFPDGNGLYFKENFENILEVNQFCHCYKFEENDAIGCAAFGITNKEDRNKTFYGIEWNFVDFKENPISYFKFNNINLFNNAELRNKGNWKQVICTRKEFENIFNEAAEAFELKKFHKFIPQNPVAISNDTLNKTKLGRCILKWNHGLIEFIDEIKKRNIQFSLNSLAAVLTEKVDFRRYPFETVDECAEILNVDDFDKIV